MKIFRYIIKVCAITVALILGLCLVYCGTSLVLSRIEVKPDVSRKEAYNIEIYLLNNGVHCDILMPVKTNVVDWGKCFKYEQAGAPPQCNTIAVGWGDKGFFLDTPEWKDLKASTAINAVFGLGESAIHAAYFLGYFREGKDCKRLTLSEKQYGMLVDYILSYLDLDGEGNAQLIPSTGSYTGYDAFYESKGHYSLFKTCNTWANTALKRCEQPACLWTAFSFGIFYHYKN